MNWINFLWPLVTGACLTIALVHLETGLRGAARKVNLMFAFLAFLMAVYSVIEWMRMYVYDPVEYLEWQRWQDIVGAATAISMAMFIWVYFGTTRRWLGKLAIVVMILSLIPNMLPEPKLVFLEITSIKPVTTFGGATFAFAEGINNPWNPVYYVGILLLVLFMVDASITYSRRMKMRQAAYLGWTVVISLLLAAVHAYFVDEGILQMPYMVSITWLFILIAMAWELSSDQLRAVNLAREVSEYRERFDLAVDEVNLGVWDWDILQDKIYVYGSSKTRANFSRNEPQTFKRYLESVYAEDRESLERLVLAAIEGDGEFQAEFRVTADDGNIHWVSAFGRATQSTAGDSHHLRGISLDVTERKQAEKEIQELRLETAQYNRIMQMNELSSSLAHEINQPLGIILSNAQAAQEFLSQDPPNINEARDILVDIVAADRRAADTIQRMRELYKRGEISFKPLQINDVIEEVLKLIQTDFVSRGIVVDFQFVKQMPLVTGDRIQLLQVMLNLILNAADAMAANAPDNRRVYIATQVNPDTVRVIVRDEGPGLPEDIDKLFKPFYTTKPKGLGMGLAICRSIIEAHRGRLWAENHPVKGAVFSFEIPVSKSQER